MAQITIRPVTHFDEMPAIQAIQRAAWNMPDVGLVPLNFFKTAAYNGGLVLGAFDGDRAVGFLLTIPAILNQPREGVEGILSGRHKFHSVMMGVHPDYHSRGIGHQLKAAQRQFAIEQGVTLVSWSYEPLLAPNAWLNIARLGGVVDLFEVAFYGEANGWAEDRFMVDWWVTSERVARRLDGAERPQPLAAHLAAGAELIACEWTAEGFPLAPAPQLDCAAETFLLEFPPDLNLIRQRAPEAALAWRHYFREMMLHYLNGPYRVIDVVRDRPEGGVERIYYLLGRR